MPISTGAAEVSAEPVGPPGTAGAADTAAAPAADAAAAANAAVNPMVNTDGDGKTGVGGADASAGGSGGHSAGGGGERGGGVSIYDLYFDAEPAAAAIAPAALSVRARTDGCMGRRAGGWAGPGYSEYRRGYSEYRWAQVCSDCKADGSLRALRLEFKRRVLQGYSQGTQQGYSQGTQQGYSAGVLTGFCKGTHRVLSRGTHRVLQGYSQGTQQGYSAGVLSRGTHMGY